MVLLRYLIKFRYNTMHKKEISNTFEHTVRAVYINALVFAQLCSKR